MNLLFIAALVILFIILGCVLCDIITKIIIEIKDIKSGSYNWEVKDKNKHNKI